VPFLGAQENVEPRPARPGRGRAARLALEALEAVGLEHRAGYGSRGSSGEQARVALARGLGRRPVLADEPTSGSTRRTPRGRARWPARPRARSPSSARPTTGASSTRPTTSSVSLGGSSCPRPCSSSQARFSSERACWPPVRGARRAREPALRSAATGR
jgi:hypothetical protein